MNRGWGVGKSSAGGRGFDSHPLHSLPGFFLIFHAFAFLAALLGEFIRLLAGKAARISRERCSWPLPRKPERSVEGRRAALLARSRLPVAGSQAKIKADA